jgi:hypothetical protein
MSGLQGMNFVVLGGVEWRVVNPDGAHLGFHEQLCGERELLLFRHR